MASISASVWPFLKGWRGPRWTCFCTWPNPNIDTSKWRWKGEIPEWGQHASYATFQQHTCLWKWQCLSGSTWVRNSFFSKNGCLAGGLFQGFRKQILTLWGLVEVRQSLTCLPLAADSLKCHPLCSFSVSVWPRLYGSPVRRKQIHTKHSFPFDLLYLTFMTVTIGINWPDYKDVLNEWIMHVPSSFYKTLAEELHGKSQGLSIKQELRCFIHMCSGDRNDSYYIFHSVCSRAYRDIQPLSRTPRSMC